MLDSRTFLDDQEHVAHSLPGYCEYWTLCRERERESLWNYWSVHCFIDEMQDVDLGIIWFVAYGEEKWLCLLFWFQGLVYNGNDTLFESTGLYGKVILIIFSSIAFFFCYFKWFSLALCIPFFHYTVGVGWEILCIFEL